MNSPLLTAFLSLCSGIILGYYYPMEPLFYSPVIFAALAAFIALYRKASRVMIVSLLSVSFFALGATLQYHQRFAYHHTELPDAIKPLLGKPVILRGRIDSIPSFSSYKVSFALITESLEYGAERPKPFRSRIQLGIYTRRPQLEPILIPGSEIKIYTRLYKGSNKSNPGAFDYSRYLLTRGYRYRGYSHDFGSIIRLSEPNPYHPSTLFARFHIKLHQLIQRASKYQGWEIIDFDRDASGHILEALFLGQRGEVPEQYAEYYRNAGIFHVLAISGLHLGLIGAILYFLFQVAGLGIRGRCIGIIVGILLYLNIVEFRSSVARAGFMIVLYLLSFLFYRQYSLPNAIVLAAFVLLIINPLSIFDAGFQMTFTITAVISISTARIQKCFRIVKPGYLRDLLSVSLAAQMGAFALIAYYFGAFPYMAWVLAVVVIPGITIVLGLQILFAITALFGFEALAMALLEPSLTLVGLISESARIASQLPYCKIAIPKPSIAFVVLYYLTIFTCFTRTLEKKRRLIALPCIVGLVVLLLASYLPEDKGVLQVNLVDIGYGESIHIKTPNGRHIMVDGGGSYSWKYDTGKLHVHPYLRHQRISELEGIISTHPDADHLSGLYYLLSNYPTGFIWTPYHFANDHLNELITMAEKMDVQVKISNKRLPNQFMPWTSNDLSAVLMLVYDDFKMLLTADIENKAEALLLPYRDLLRCHLLKVPHHGGLSSSSEDFIDATDPSVAVISCEGTIDNPKPHPVILERYQDRKIVTFYTDRDGMIRINSTGKDYEVSVFPALKAR